MITERATIIRQNRKSIKILISEMGEINIYAPKHITNSDIEKLIGNKESWAINKSNKMKETYSSNIEIIGYKSVLICGRIYKIEYDNIKKIGIINQTIYVPDKYKDKQKLITALKKWFKLLAEDILAKRLQTLSIETNLAYNGFKIGDFRSKWGSCDSVKVIKLNYKLVMLPHKVIDAVILHELVHTKVMNHSATFYNKLFSLMPEYKKYRTVLKSFGYLLKMY